MATTLTGRLTGASGEAYAGYRVTVRFEKQFESEDLWIPTELSAEVAPDGNFALELPDRKKMRGPWHVEVFAPDGQRMTSRDLDAEALGQPLPLRVVPKDVFTVEPHPDPDLGKREKLLGRVIDGAGRQQVADTQLVVWARGVEGSAPQPLFAARTDKQGYFSVPYPRGPFGDAFADVAVGRGQTVPIPLTEGEFSRRVVLAVKLPAQIGPKEDDCTCDTDVPRVPDVVELTTSPETYSQDPGQCVNFNVPNRTLEEFDYYQIIRTTEPEIQGLTLKDDGGVRIPPDLVVNIFPVSAGTLTASLDLNSFTEATTATATRALAPSVLKSLAVDPDQFDAQTLVVAERETAFRDLSSILTKFKKKVPGRAALTASNPVDWDDEPTFYQATSIAHGHILHFKQAWKADGYSLGDLLYSLPLAPCQKKQIAVVDWERRETAARVEMLEEEESLASVLTRDRDISEIVSSSLREDTRGGSKASTWAAGGGLGFAIGPLIVGAAGGGGGASSTAWQNSSRDLAASSLQQLRDTTMQAASAVRSQRSTVVQSATQGETMRVTTEVVANHNHCHAITMEYFEVLRHFQVDGQLADVQECLFVPLPMARFDNAKILRWRETLNRFLREPSLRKAFAAIERIVNNYAGSDLPTGRYSEETLLDLDGEMRISFSIARPADKDGAFDADKWRVISLLTHRALDYWYNLFLRERQQKDRLFREQVAPRIAEAFAQSLTFFLRSGATEHPVPLDPTLVSKYDEEVPLYITLRPAGRVPGIRREDVNGFTIRTAHTLPPYSRALVQSASLRYRTTHLNRFLFREPRVMNDLSTSDSVYIGVTLDREELRNPRQEDREIARKLLDHLNENLEYYHQAIWMSMDPERRYMLLDGYVAPNSGNRSVASVVENRLIGIVGNSLVMPVARGFHLDPTYKQDVENPIDLLHHYAPNMPIPATRVSVPTRGVFAEAVMGSCNSCEEKDDTRFWRFEESPCGDEPTAIQPVSTASRRSDQPDMTAKDFPAPMINLQTAPAAPDPTGLAAALNLIGTPNLFRDITGLEGNQKNALAAFNSVMDTAKFFGGEASKLAMQKQLGDGMDKTLKTIQNAREDGLLTDEQANALTQSALLGMAGESRGKTPNLTDNAEVKKLLDSTTKSGGTSEVSLTRGNESVAVTSEGKEEEPREGQAVNVIGTTDVLDHVQFGWQFDRLTLGGVVPLGSPVKKLSDFRKFFNVKQRSSTTLFEEFRWGDAIVDRLMKPGLVDATQARIPVGARVHFPADPADLTKLVPGSDLLPVAIIVHGNHDALQFTHKPAVTTTAGSVKTNRYDVDVITEIGNHTGHLFLQDELAKHGIVSVSVNMNLANFGGSLLFMRSEWIFQTLKFLQRLNGDASSIFFGRLDLEHNVGLIGHSRGGDAVIHFATKNASRTGADHFAVKAVCAIAPTDFTGVSSTPTVLKSGTDNLMFLGMYGSHDADVDGLGGTNSLGGNVLRQYDRFDCHKVACFYRGFTHNRFNTNWNNLPDYGDGGHPHVNDPTLAIDPEIRSDADHQAVTSEMVSAFLRFLLKGDATQRQLLDGSKATTVGIQTTRQWDFRDLADATTRKPVDGFEGTTNAAGGARTLGTGATITKFKDAKVGGVAIAALIPHETKVLQADVSSAATDSVLIEKFPTLPDLTGFELTFRMRRTFPDFTDQLSLEAAGPPILRIRLFDTDSATEEINEAQVYAHSTGTRMPPVIAKVWRNGPVDTTKLVFETYRVPLSEFTVVDLKKINKLEFEVNQATGTHVFIDSLIFVKL